MAAKITQDMKCAVCSYPITEEAAKFIPPAPTATFQPTVEDWLEACGWVLSQDPNEVLCRDCNFSND